MNNSIITIDNVKGYIGENNLIYLNLEDVARGLGFVDVKNNIEYVRWTRVRKYLSDFNFSTSGESDFIPENVFYLLCMKASNEVAKQFQLKVANEILPQIRQSGMYMTENVWDMIMKDPQKFGEMIIEYGKVRKENEKLQLENEKKQKLIEKQQPKVEYYDKVTNSKKATGMSEVAKVLKFKVNNRPIGRNILFSILRDSNILNEYNQPYQRFINLGYFEVRQTYNSYIGEPLYTTLVTSKGIEYIFKLLRKLGYEEYE